MESTVKREKKVESPYWTARQSADYLNCSTGAIWNWVRMGKLLPHRRGSVVRFNKQDVKQMLEPAQ
jgi:excisionase family DNA binding protein